MADSSSVTIMMECQDIEGASEARGFEKNIELLSYSHVIKHDVTTDTSNGTRTIGKAGHGEFTVDKYFDLSSCKLIHKCNMGKDIKRVEVKILQSIGDLKPLLTYSMDNVVITEISVICTGADKPKETIKMSYTKIQWTYEPQDKGTEKKGKDSAEYNLARVTGRG